MALQLFPVKYALAQGQINLFVFLAGATLALITIMKLNPILLIIYFLVLKKYRLIAYCLATLILLNLAYHLATLPLLVTPRLHLFISK